MRDTEIKKLLWRTVTVLLLLGLAFALLSALLQKQMVMVANWVSRILGLWGIGAGVLLADSVFLPIPPELYLLVALAQPKSVVGVLVAISVGSVIGGSIAYVLGPWISKLPFTKRPLEAFRPQGEKMFQRWGAWTVVIVSLTPLPFSLTCWLAGVYKMPFRSFWLCTLTRAPRFVLYYLVFSLGWMSPVA